MTLKVTPTRLCEVLVVEPEVFGDDSRRPEFPETYFGVFVQVAPDRYKAGSNFLSHFFNAVVHGVDSLKDCRYFVECIQV